jgi:hypothetical protein
MTFRTRGRRLIISSSGQLGLAPIATQPGDCILIITGHGVPVVARAARPRTDNLDGPGDILWHLIGECFVDGVMEGEMMESDMNSGQEPLHFI